MVVNFIMSKLQIIRVVIFYIQGSFVVRDKTNDEIEVTDLVTNHLLPMNYKQNFDQYFCVQKSFEPNILLL